MWRMNFLLYFTCPLKSLRIIYVFDWLYFIKLMTILVLIGMVFVINWEMIFSLSVFAAAIEFCEWVQVRIDVYIPHHEYQVKS